MTYANRDKKPRVSVVTHLDRHPLPDMHDDDMLVEPEEEEEMQDYSDTRRLLIAYHHF